MIVLKWLSAKHSRDSVTKIFKNHMIKDFEKFKQVTGTLNVYW